MEQESVRDIIKATYYPRVAATAALSVLAIFLLIAAAGEFKSYRYIGSGVMPTDTIQVTGEGEAFAVPDTATFSVTIEEKASEVTKAQTAATAKSNAIVEYLKGQGIDEKDIQTTDYSVNPQYVYSNTVCTSGGYCPPGRQTLDGYQVSQTLSIKVRDTEKAGALLSGVGSKGASSVSGLSFTVADQDKIDAEARDKAIAQAREKAQVLARSLGVSLVRIVGFNENNGGQIYYAKAMMAGGAAMDSAVQAPAPAIPVGQNKVTSNVTVTYEIR